MSCWQLGQKAAMKVMVGAPFSYRILFLSILLPLLRFAAVLLKYITTWHVVIEVLVIVEQCHYTVCHTDGYGIYFADKNVASLPKKCYTVYETTRFASTHSYI